jgi:anaphase-promoting complex subunit 1
VAKHQQDLAFRIAERTMALAMGRAIFTFGSVTHVTNDTYRVPKLEYSVRMLPMNVVVAPDPTKVQPDATHWAEFHNGVAAGLRIAPSSHPIASSWITFHKPSELSPEHAGFLYGLGLTGHLKSMLTWHTFTYLTPKHDLTSIAVLLGLSAAWKGTGNRHVRKLLAIHTPALLPKSSMELNIPLLTQAAGISGVGLLYMGTAHRRMAEVCLGEMYKKDASSITSTANATKEAYVVSAALAFGMIMLGRGFTSNNAADAEFVSRLKTMIKGISGYGNGTEAPFDWNAAAPAACIALGLMFLRTNRKDISEIMLLPDSLEGLNRVPPHFLFYRALGRDLIMWDNIMPTLEWIMGHFPPDVRKTMEARARGVRCDLAYEYAYYYTVAAACFAIGLKYAGTAKEQAYLTLMHFYDLYSKLGWGPGMSRYLILESC